VDNSFKSPAVISFCPGILGIERGLKRAGVHPRVVAYVEIEAFIIANLVAGMEAGILDPAPIWTDAKTFDARPFRGRIHGIIGGYPCQPFSIAGKQNGEEHDHHIWPNIRNAADIIRPPLLFFENVVNHLNIGYQQVKSDLEELGYCVKEGIYSASEAGAPQRRERLFILAITGNTKGNNDWNDWYKSFKSKKQIGGPGIELANSESEPGRLLLQSGEPFQNDADIIGSGESVVYAISKGLQGHNGNDEATEGWQEQDRSVTKADFPMGQGFEQYQWEEPRTIESGLGCTINGYNYQEDILRALGNSVVEQTVELAFIDLMNKHLSSLEK
jgi:DNA (cytosine-5)-methyltransferase 1